MANFSIHHRHYGWDRDRPPVLEVESGAEIELDVLDASDGQITPGANAADLTRLDPGRANPVNGPVRVAGAKPGDALAIEILGLEGEGWGWTGIIPGFGLLADEIPGPHLMISRYDGRFVEFGPGLRIPQRAFPGTVGVAPAAAGHHPIIPPRAVGGNMDYRRLVEGATVILPVAVEGALWSLGDTHAAQGHGEVCGTAIESPMRAQVRCTVRPGDAPRFPRFECPADAERGKPAGVATSGVGPDLHAAARDAVREMIDLLMKRHGLDQETAYCLCSVAGDLVIGEVVNAPNWVVAFELPTDVLS